MILVPGSKVNANFGILCIKPRGHNTDYSVCSIMLNLHMQVMMREGTLLILLHRFKGQGKLNSLIELESSPIELESFLI